MPELPEVETVRRGLEKTIKSATIKQVTLTRRDLRIPFPRNFANQLTNRKILGIGRRAKYLLFRLSGGKVLVSHLGMSGRFVLKPKMPAAFSPHDHVIFTLKDGRTLLYNDARRFGLMTIVDKHSLYNDSLFVHLGPEPFDKSFSENYLKKSLAARTTNIKTALMDQTLVVGVGNIYASEALFLSHIHPQHRACDIKNKYAVIIKSIRIVLMRAIKSGGSSLRDFVDIEGYSGKFQHRFNVYDRAGKPCYACGAKIKTLRQSGRSTFFCPQCQQ